MGPLIPLSTPNLEALPFDLSGMGALPEAYTPASITLRLMGARIPRLHDKAVGLEEEQT
jgi:hypothetical protein